MIREKALDFVLHLKSKVMCGLESLALKFRKNMAK